MPKHGNMDKLLVIGSGPVVIGQSEELDQAGALACDALRSIGYHLIIVHTDPAATITDTGKENRVYIEPLDFSTLSQIIALEKPDAVLATFGGQTALNLTYDLSKKGLLSKYNIDLLGLSSLALHIGVNRMKLKALSLPNGIEHSRFTHVNSSAEAVSYAEEFGYPVLVRSIISEPGFGNSMAYNIEELQRSIKTRLVTLRNKQVMLEESLLGCKEIEVLVVRDSKGRRVVWGCLENLDPVGIHRNDSVVTIPVQSIPADVLKRMEQAGRQLAEDLKITGLISLLFAFQPGSSRIVLLNITPTASRSTSLVNLAAPWSSHHTAALLAGGMLLEEMPWWPLPDSISKISTPHKILVKFPSWTFNTFSEVPDRLNIHMQSVSEVVGIGDSFNTAFQKALRSTAVESKGLASWSDIDFGSNISRPNPSDFHSSKRYFYIYSALKAGESISNLHQMTRIDPFFLNQLKKLAEIEIELSSLHKKDINADLLIKAKSNGFSNTHLAACLGYTEKEIQNKYQNVLNASNYVSEPINYPSRSTFKKKKRKREVRYLMIGPGPLELGHGLGFNHNNIQAAYAVKDLGYEPVRINCNPSSATIRKNSVETTYLEPLNMEEVAAIYKKEKAQGVLVQFGGPKIASWAPLLCQAGLKIVGLKMETTVISNNYGRFRDMINKMGLAQPDYEIVQSYSHLSESAQRVGYPVLIRPEARFYETTEPAPLIIMDPAMMSRYFDLESKLHLSEPLLVERFLEYAIECEVDALCDGKEVFIPTVLEHIELAGVYCADAACVTPPYSTPLRHVETIYEYTRKIIRKLKVKGVVNIRFAILNDTVYVLDLKPWADHTVPLSSKICNIPLAYTATQILLGKSLSDLKLKQPLLPYFGVRAAVFPFTNFPQVDPLLGPKVFSTGSVLSLDRSFGLSYFKSQKAVLSPLPLSGCVLITVTDVDKPSILEPVRQFNEMGFSIKATKGTQAFLKRHGIPAKIVRKLGFGRPNLVDAIKNGEIDLVINTPSGKDSQIDDAYIRKAAIECQVPNITVPAGALAAAKGIAARLKGRPQVMSLQDYHALIK
jgi:carbamoyl-phosphate synthase large subunit